MHRALRLVSLCVALVVGGGGIAASFAATSSAPARSVLVVPIDGEVDVGMQHLVERAVAQANAADEPLVLDVNTPGGLVDSAFAIRDALFAAKVPTIAFVSERAFSAGALITLACRRIVMAPGASIGAAEPIVTGPDQSHQAKYVAALASEFRATAERNHRDGRLASAMVDKHVDTPGYKAAGAILSLTASEAKRAGLADAVDATLPDALRDSDLGGAAVAHVSYSFGEQLARLATSPEVSGILLSIGVLGLLIEMQTLHGIAGLIGVLALATFFGTHVYIGLADWLVVLLALLGVIGILLELHVIPGHGVAGLLGVLLLVAAVVLSFGSASLLPAAQAISIAIVVTVAGFALLLRWHPENAFVRRIAFRGEQGAEYVASSNFRELVGKRGVASSLLRPAGVATFDGRRFDVLTTGEFVAAGADVAVDRVEGARIFVHQTTSEEPA